MSYFDPPLSLHSMSQSEKSCLIIDAITVCANNDLVSIRSDVASICSYYLDGVRHETSGSEHLRVFRKMADGPLKLQEGLIRLYPFLVFSKLPDGRDRVLYSVDPMELAIPGDNTNLTPLQLPTGNLVYIRSLNFSPYVTPVSPKFYKSIPLEGHPSSSGRWCFMDKGTMVRSATGLPIETQIRFPALNLSTRCYHAIKPYMPSSRVEICGGFVKVTRFT